MSRLKVVLADGSTHTLLTGQSPDPVACAKCAAEPGTAFMLDPRGLHKRVTTACVPGHAIMKVWAEDD